MKNKIYKAFLMLSALALTIGCSETDDATGESTSSPTSPSLSVTLDFPSTQNLVEDDSSFGFTVSLSQPQIAAVDVYLELLPNSTASEGSDLSFPHSVRIPAGSTSVSDVITILSDDVAEPTETAVIRIGTGFESNVSTTNSQTVSFNIMNYTEGDIAIDMTWTSPQDFTDNLGNAIADEAIGDLVLYVTDPNIPTSINYVTVDNEFGFESFVFLESYPDGEYYLVAEFFSAEDFGGNDAALDISLTFNQPGVINNRVVTVPNALNTAFAFCQSTVLARIIKSGTNYTIESVGLPNANPGIPADGTFVGDYAVATTVAGGFGPLFDGNVTLVDEGDGVRSFMGDWNGFGLVRPWQFFFQAGPCGPEATFVDGQSTGLACAAPAITLNTSSTPAIIDPFDDSSFSVVFVEDLGGCGGTPMNVEITFTKL
jgi:hypothetical protein